MANTYIIRCEVDFNGINTTDFKGFTETARVVSKAVNLMHKTGNAQVTRRFAFALDYVVPSVNETDFESLIGASGTGTCGLLYDNGTKTDFGGVSVIEVGDAALDGENELVKRISFMSETRNGDTE